MNARILSSDALIQFRGLFVRTSDVERAESLGIGADDLDYEPRDICVLASAIVAIRDNDDDETGIELASGQEYIVQQPYEEVLDLWRVGLGFTPRG